MGTWASIASVVFTAVAALLWGCSTLVNLPVIGSGYGAIARAKEGAVRLRAKGILTCTSPVENPRGTGPRSATLLLPGRAREGLAAQDSLEIE
jgi:hypothetical protein